MKSFYTLFFTYLFMLAVGLPFSSAQQLPDTFRNSIEFKYGASKKGKLNYWVYYQLPNKAPQFRGLKNIDIDMVGGTTSGSLFIVLKLNSLDENYNLVLPARCIKGSSHLKLKPSLSRTYILNKKKETSVTLEYLVSDEGDSLFKIGYDILPKEQNEPGDCNLDMIVDYKVTHFKSPDKSTCEKAKSEFTQNSENTDPLGSYLKTYPGGECSEEFRGYIRQSQLFNQIKTAADQGNCDRVKDYSKIYSDKYPNGVYTDKVTVLLNKCTTATAATAEDIAWEREKNNGATGMKKYLGAYKTSPKYKNEAKTKLIALFHNRTGTEAKSAAKVFLQYFGNDNTYAKEAKKLLEVAAPVAPKKVNCESDWDKVKNSTCAKILREFVAANPDCDRVLEANVKIEELSRSNFKVEKTGNKVRLAAPAGQKLQWKDLSLDKRLSVSLQENGQVLEASFEGEGKYVLYVKEAECGKDTTVELSSEFYAKMEVLKGGSQYVVNIIGGQPPYSAALISAIDNKVLPLPDEFIMNDKIAFTQKDLKRKYAEGLYSIEVKDSKASVYRLKEGVKSQASNVDIVLILVVLSGILALVLTIYLIFSLLKNRKRKETIYDVQY
ncbi:MAG: hypothetical protein IPN76_26285 [Saprospiraceae bacterium]|nr:hypothetical protein [Saprospiraceae bacterium]